MVDKELREAIKPRIEDNAAVDIDFLLLEPLVNQLVTLFNTYLAKERRDAAVIDEIIKKISEAQEKLWHDTRDGIKITEIEVGSGWLPPEVTMIDTRFGAVKIKVTDGKEKMEFPE
jgi:hypothetical protein